MEKSSCGAFKKGWTICKNYFLFTTRQPRQSMGGEDNTGNPVNHGDGKGMKVPCILRFIAQKRFIDVLRNELGSFLVQESFIALKFLKIFGISDPSFL